MVPAQVYLSGWLKSFQEFTPRQKPGRFNLGDAMEKLTAERRRLTSASPAASRATRPKPS